MERNVKFVPTTVTLYSPSGSVPPTKPQSTVTQLPQPATIQPASIPLPLSKMSTPDAQSAPTSLPAGTLQPPPTATESGEEEMPEEEELTPATPAPSPLLRPTLLWMPVLRASLRHNRQVHRRRPRSRQRTSQFAGQCELRNKCKVANAHQGMKALQEQQLTSTTCLED